MRALVAATVLLLVALTPTAGAFTFAAASPAADPHVATLVGHEPLIVPLTVLINCTVGEASLEELRVDFRAENENQAMDVHVNDTRVTVAAPVACDSDRSFELSTNATFRFTKTIDARDGMPALIHYDARAGLDGKAGLWSFILTQAYDPAVSISLPEGFTFQTAPGGSFSIPVRVVHNGNAPVTVTMEARTLSRYAAQSVSTPPPVHVDWPDGGEPVPRVLHVTGTTRDAVGNVNQTLVLELRVEVVPQDVAFQEFYTERGLFVVHINVAKSHLRPPDDAASPGPGTVGLGAAVAIAVMMARARQRSLRPPRS
jgi:hypothetical protein